MTSRLTVSALVFSLLSTAVIVCTASVATPEPARNVRVVQLERVTIVMPRLLAKA